MEPFNRERAGMLISRRVQDRFYALSKTMRQPKEEEAVEKLKLHGKVVTVFLLWILWIIACWTFFCGEHIFIRFMYLCYVLYITILSNKIHQAYRCLTSTKSDFLCS